MSNPFESIIGLVTAIAMIPVVLVAILLLMHWMMTGDIDAGAGIVAITVVLLVSAVTITSHSTVAVVAVLICMVTLMVFFPYASDQLAKADLQGMDIDKLDKAHQQLVSTPENIATFFLVAEMVYALGLEGHAIAICESTLDKLSTQIDPIKNQSMREVFRAEESRTREWRRQVRDPDAFRAVACPRCRHRNEPGTLACGRCNGPFLLDLARQIDPRPRVKSRLVFGWALLALFFAGTVYGMVELEGVGGYVVLAAGLAMVATVLYRLFGRRAMTTR
ncbi:MAG: hypothetical protein IH945_08540 [Armatimonadetes bacterium]|nr:hypothetical protein [Armatimonadota bacterium]